MIDLVKKVLAYGISGAIGLIAFGWSAKIALEDAKADFKVEILGEVKDWRQADMEVIKSIKEDTAIIKQALISKGVGK
jgi:hypothetical protein